MNPITELLSRLNKVATRCREARWFGALFHVTVLQDIAADVRAWFKSLRAEAHSCEVHSLEADLSITEGYAALNNHDITAAKACFDRADRLIKQSAATAHTLSETLVTE